MYSYEYKRFEAHRSDINSIPTLCQERSLIDDLSRVKERWRVSDGGEIGPSDACSLTSSGYDIDVETDGRRIPSISAT